MEIRRLDPQLMRTQWLGSPRIQRPIVDSTWTRSLDSRPTAQARRSTGLPGRGTRGRPQARPRRLG